MLFIYTPSITSRVQYIFNLLLTELLGLEYRLTNQKDEFSQYDGIRLVYDKSPMEEELFLETAGLLYETGIYPHELHSREISDLPVIFECSHPLSLLPFDPFSAAFYMVTRYEEYNRHKKDKYGRFQVTESIAWQGKFLEMPIIHLWAEQLSRVLLAYFPDLVFTPPDYRFIPTIDIDHLYAYRGRGVIRTLGSACRALLKGNFEDISTRFRVLSGLDKDPYDIYDYLHLLHLKMKLNPVYFILFANYGGDDNNISLRDKNFPRILRELDSEQGVGIHPSLSSNKHTERLESELIGLSKILCRDILVSRQHFLKISFPRTYRNLIKMGITDDFSMGFASHMGFRAGIAIPFNFFDLSKNESTGLRVHPVAIMDVTLMDYLRLSPEKSLETIRRVITTIKAVNGEFVSLWHNESLSEAGRWKGWSRVYSEMLEMAAE